MSCIQNLGLLQPPLTPVLTEEKRRHSSFRTEERKEGREEEKKKIKIEMKPRKEKRIFGRICGEWERKN